MFVDVYRHIMESELTNCTTELLKNKEPLISQKFHCRNKWVFQRVDNLRMGFIEVVHLTSFDFIESNEDVHSV